MTIKLITPVVTGSKTIYLNDKGSIGPYTRFELSVAIR